MRDYTKIDAFVRRLVAESTPERTAWNLEKVREGKPVTWNYIDGCMLTCLMELTAITGDEFFAAFAERVADHFVQADGSILTLQPEKANLDDVNEGRVLFPLYVKTGKEKYRLAAERLRAMLEVQPRTKEGSFWHKAIYPNQVWLDGIYMAQPFLALYETRFGSGSCADTVRQIQTVRARMYDEASGLYYHGYDASRRAFWADPETGRSKSFWLRSIGWFSVALADLMEILPAGEERDALIPIFTELMGNLRAYADPETGMYWQVPDQPGREGNYLETSGSAMLSYAMLKGARLGLLPSWAAELGEKTFHGILDKYLHYTEDGLDLGGICLVAGLGPENNRRRDGTYAYYISEPVVHNDAKGVAPFVLAYTEILRNS